MTSNFTDQLSATQLKSSPLIHVIEGDHVQAELLSKVLTCHGYRVQLFADDDSFYTALSDDIVERPSVVVIGTLVVSGDDITQSSTNNITLCKNHGIPVLVISEHDDLQAMLCALQIGASRYMSKPISPKSINKILDDMISAQPQLPYRVLIIGNETTPFKAYSGILTEAGMVVHALRELLKFPGTVKVFNPCVVVFDLPVSGVSGLEIATMLHERDAQLPILFLSAETDIRKQLLALNLVVDDVISKPVEPEHLLLTVTTRARRARETLNIQRQLQTALYEREQAHQVLNQHAIVSVADRAGNITYVNDLFCEVSGYSREELLGKNHHLIKSGQHSSAFYQQLWKTISTGKVWKGEICNRRKDGSLYWVESTITPFLDGSGEPYRYVSIRTEITRVKESEQAFEIHKERLRLGQVFAKVGTWDWNIENGDLFWSELIAPLFGYPEGNLETTFENFMAAIHIDDREMVSNEINACVKNDLPYDIEHRVVWPDGTIRWLHERGAVVRDDSGNSVHMLGVVDDIDDRKHAELALLESEQLLRNVQALSHIGSWRMDLGSCEMTWSDEVYRIFGYEPGRFKPSVQAFHDAIHSDDLERVKKEKIRAEKTGMYDETYRILQPDGSVSYVRERARVIADISGKLTHMRGSVQDVTEQVKAENRQRQDEERVEKQKKLLDMLHRLTTAFVEKGNFNEAMDNILSTLLEVTGSEYGFTGEVLYNDDGNPYLKTYAITNTSGNAASQALYNKISNSGFEFNNLDTLFGHVLVSRQAVMSNNFASDLRTGGLPEGHPPMHNFLGIPVFYGNEMVGMYAIANRPGGYDEEVRTLLRPLDTTFGTMIHSKHVMDLDESSRLALINAKELAEQASQTKTDFLSSMSHELRTPMNAILGFGQLLEYDDTLSSDQQENVTEITKAGRHLLELINEVLDLAKVESGQIDLSLEPVELSLVIEECLSLVASLADKRNVSLYTKGGGGIVIQADRTRLKQVILNLLSNAIKYNREGGSVKLDVLPHDTGFLGIRVTDTGVGISDKGMAGLFQPFNRLDAEEGSVEGTGIGLTITRRIIEVMGGTVSVESEIGVGSTFWIELPLGSPVGLNQQYDDQVDDDGILAQPKVPARYTVLYIDDDPANLKLVSQLLAKRKYISLLTAHTGELGVEQAIIKQPDLILLDINMPGMDGFQVLKVLKAEAALENTPFIAVSINSMPSDIQHGKEAGFSEYVTKPINVGQFLKSIDCCLQGG